MFEMRQLCYTMIGKIIPERKASQHSVYPIPSNVRRGYSGGSRRVF